MAWPGSGAEGVGGAPPYRVEAGWRHLFLAVQRSRALGDGKCFVDMVPRRDLAEIVAAFGARALGDANGHELRRFVEANFEAPDCSLARILDHVEALWPLLSRPPDSPASGSSLLPLPRAYTVPGGRFREVYYWDSYFTMLGLLESGRVRMVADMVENFAHLIRTFGFVPNGNRTYYLSRSQPPYFALMLDLLPDREQALCRYLPELRAEHSYWSDRTHATRHGVRMPGGETLARYYDQSDTPRPEAWAQDEQVALNSARPLADCYRDLRSAAESGWDFSSRWLSDARNLASIETTRIVPVDLNCLLWKLEKTIQEAMELAGRPVESSAFAALAATRAAAIDRYCWDGATGFYGDFHMVNCAPTGRMTLAGVMPLVFKLANADQARSVATVIESRFLQEGGLVTSLAESEQQWDWPNGWAPLHWLAVRGLENYGFAQLASSIAGRWIGTVSKGFSQTGKLLEKYDVVHPGQPGGGGEYPLQDGFGWTNGVLLALARRYGTEGTVNVGSIPAATIVYPPAGDSRPYA